MANVVQVRIASGSLWVGSNAYPLRNISYVGQWRLVVNKGAAWRRFVMRVLLISIIGGILVATLDTIGVLILVAAMALAIWRLVAVLVRPVIYGLVISTAGTQRAAVWSTDGAEIDYLVQEVALAIGNPDTAQLIFNVENAVSGDFVQQYGDGSVGTATHHGAGNILGGS